MSALKELVVRILGDNSDLSKKMDDATGKLKKFGDSATKAGGVLTAGITLPIVGIGVAAIKTALDSQQGLSQTEAVIKSTGGAAGVTTQHVLDLASAQLKLTGIDDDAVQAGENMLLTFRHIGAKGGIFDTATKTALDMATAMNGGVTPSAEQVRQTALQMGKALDNPTKGYAMLQRVGVSFTQSQVDQIKKLQASGDMMGAQKIILNELGKEFGGSAAASGKTFGGMLEGLKNQAGNLLQAMGDKLLPMLMKGLAAITPVVIQVTDVITNMSPALIPIILAVGGVVAAIGPLLLIVGQLAGAISALLPVISAVGGVIAAVGGGPITLIVVGIAALVAGIVLLITHWKQITQAIQSNPVFQFFAQKILPVLVSAFQDLGNTLRSQVGPIIAQLQETLQQKLIPAWNAIQQALNTAKPAFVVIGAIVGGVLLVVLGLLIGVLKGVFSALGPILGGVIQVFGGIVQVISGVVQVIVGIFQVLVGLVKGIFTGDWTTLGDGLKNLKDGVLNILGGLWTAVVGIFQGLVGGVVGLVSGLVSGVIGFFQGLWEKIVGHSIIPDLVNGVLQWIDNLVGTFLSFIGGLVSKVIAFFLQLGVRVLTAINLMINLVLAAVNAWVNRVLSFIGNLVARGINFFLSLGVGILNAVNGFINLVLAFVDHWVAEFVARIQRMIALAQAIFHGVIEVITAPFNQAKSIVSGIIDDIKGFFTNLHLPTITLPHINLPHFSITGSFNLNPPSVPHLDVQWYAKGGIVGLNGPQMIGVGEAGPEAVIPLDRLSSAGGGGGGGASQQPTLIQLDGRTIVRAFLPYIVEELRRSGAIRSI